MCTAVVESLGVSLQHAGAVDDGLDARPVQQPLRIGACRGRPDTGGNPAAAEARRIGDRMASAQPGRPPASKPVA